MDLTGITALVVDDHADTLELVALVLEWAGADVLVARSARDAERLLDDHGVDVIVCDEHLPHVDGCSFVRRVRQRVDEKRAVPVLGVSGDVEPRHIGAMLEAGFDDFLAKPLDTDVLVEAVGRVVDGPCRTAATGTSGP